MSKWYYTRDGHQQGPVSEVELKGEIESGRLSGSSLAWAEGMADWKPISSIQELSAASSGAATATEGSRPESDASNPYAAPASGFETLAASTATIDDLPKVRRSNYMLMAILYTIGCLGVLAGYGFIFASIFTGEAGVPHDRIIMVGSVVVCLALIPLCIGGIMSLIYLHRAWTLLQPNTPYATPGRAVGFLFIPFYNLYWMFVAYWRWAQEWNRLVASNPKHAAAPQASEGLFLAFAIINIAGVLLGILALIPMMVVFLIMMKTICSAVNYAARD